jgi:hypothetical protein
MGFEEDVAGKEGEHGLLATGAVTNPPRKSIGPSMSKARFLRNIVGNRKVRSNQVRGARERGREGQELLVLTA